MVTILSVDPSENQKLKNCLKRSCLKFIGRGWDKNEEIKASKIYSKKGFGADSVCYVLNGLVKIPTLEVHYIGVNKNKITSQSLRDAPYGVSYNYFAGELLSILVFEEQFTNLNLIYDLRNKESHNRRHFEEYLKTKIFGTAFEKQIEVTMGASGMESTQSKGLQAVDFFSWSIFRNVEYKDPRFTKIFAHKIGRRKEWYI